MGLFSTLAAATNSEEGSSSTPTSSATIATVVQLYANQQIILMEETPSVTGYSSLTYQAVQVGASGDAEVKNKHANPDLGVWNCKVLVDGSKENSDPLVDSLLSKLAAPSELAPPSSVYCVTVDLSDETTVETTLSALQAALVRHLIEHPPKGESNTKTMTTNLYDLQTVQFGLAADETPAERSVEESFKEVKVGLMICAVVSSKDSKSIDESSEAAYKKKQARALVVYHLRKFATAMNAALCFVERPSETEETKDETPSESAPSNEDVQLAVDYDKLSQLWRDMATGIPIWEETPAGTEATALYGPGRQQEDLIDTILLRNANYPGHWDASKDSLWVALPAAESSTTTDAGTTAAGDDGWLTQLRDSIASALPQTTEVAKEPTPKKAATPAKKEAEVSDFFASLLKNP
eukprot:CAMPEP_0116142858 /NCGR_PEP_ID=MMETSP0329-20121206/15133_1 /TAXON_ID=697910 /ORGANISM="Pseudo-nitzschia arenysensis, Strain B593" /LENGTH=408 /DNA_ID=CAMNT_0003638123 /DNA_START=135 /DNA_END=1361 /DNA_ORIENTATION=+